MPVRYDLYANPSHEEDDEESSKLHARVVPYSTIETEQMAKEMNYSSTLTPADIKAVLTGLGDTITRHLKNGNSVHIDGLGYFQMTLDCPPIHSEKDIRAASINFRSISFRPEKIFKDKFRDTVFVRNTEKRHSNNYSQTEIDALLSNFFSNHKYITRRQLEILCGLTQSTANRRLKELIARGKLRKEGYFHFPLYFPVKPGESGPPADSAIEKQEIH